jgi:hypothetical protein
MIIEICRVVNDTLQKHRRYSILDSKFYFLLDSKVSLIPIRSRKTIDVDIDTASYCPLKCSLLRSSIKRLAYMNYDGDTHGAVI